MSVICLICKDKLLSTAPGSSFGSLNSLVENQAISTGCGHLYHYECLQTWFLTQKKKLQNQGIIGNFPDHCPTCQTVVYDEQIRRIYLLEDHRESLERAVLLEKLENLEIHCHQLEVHVQQLQRENDLLINKALSPTPSNGKGTHREVAAIVKNDKIMWLKKDSPPLSGVVLTIFKKDGSLWVKIRLDKKIRTNSRSGLFGSFRFDKKQELTVPFDEIMLEKDFRKNNIVHEREFPPDEPLPSPSPMSPTVSFHKMNSFRSSTLSLPGEYLSHFQNRMPSPHQMHPVSSFDFVNNYGSTIELSHTILEQPEDGSEPVSSSASQMHIPTAIIPLTVAVPTSTASVSLTNEERSKYKVEQRDYILFDPPKSPKFDAPTHLQLNGRPHSEIFTSTPQITDIKTKHVTFADDLLLEKKSSMRNRGNHFRDHDYRNVIEMSAALDKRNSSASSTSTTMDVEPKENDESRSAQEEDLTVNGVQLQWTPGSVTLLVPTVTTNLDEPSNSTPSTPGSLSSERDRPHSDLQTDVFIDSYEVPLKSFDGGYNRSCFDITFAMLFYDCQMFDKLLLMGSGTGDDIQRVVQQILLREFVIPLRDPERHRYFEGYSLRFHDAIAHLCSSYLDLEELMTILFEYVFKISPFISYSFDMCDYIHQFFIDFTDKEKTPSVEQLLERSLLLQDNLKLRAEPSPALFLQMPNSEDGRIIHYDAVLPSLALNIENLLENDAMKSDGGGAATCYCNKVATLECATCAKLHGKCPVLFCEECSVLLEAIHDQMYHKLDLVPINAISPSANSFELSGVICLKDSQYRVFLRDSSGEGEETNEKCKWRFIEDFRDGRPVITELPQFEEWVEKIVATPGEINVEELSKLQRALLTECRMFCYVPVQNSFA